MSGYPSSDGFDLNMIRTLVTFGDPYRGTNSTYEPLRSSCFEGKDEAASDESRRPRRNHKTSVFPSLFEMLWMSFRRFSWFRLCKGIWLFVANLKVITAVFRIQLL